MPSLLSLSGFYEEEIRIELDTDGREKKLIELVQYKERKGEEGKGERRNKKYFL